MSHYSGFEIRNRVLENCESNCKKIEQSSRNAEIDLISCKQKPLCFLLMLKLLSKVRGEGSIGALHNSGIASTPAAAHNERFENDIRPSYWRRLI